MSGIVGKGRSIAMYNLIRYDAYGNYEVLQIGKTYQQCEIARNWDIAEGHREWYSYEIVPYTPY